MTTSTSVSQMAGGISLVSFNSRPDGMHQRSYSVSSADQWSEATVIANSGISSGKKPGAGRGCHVLWGEGGVCCSCWFFFQKGGKKKTPTKRNGAAPSGAELAAPEGKILMR